MWSRQQNAVSVRHAFKTYGSKSKPNQVLNNLNMTVSKGTMQVHLLITQLLVFTALERVRNHYLISARPWLLLKLSLLAAKSAYFQCASSLSQQYACRSNKIDLRVHGIDVKVNKDSP